MITHLPARVAACLTIAAAVAGCGSDDDSGGGGAAREAAGKPKEAAPSSVVEVGVGGPLRFDRRRYSAEAGNVRLEITNPARIGHNVRVQPAGKPCCTRFDMGGTNTVSDGQRSAAAVRLDPGRYTLYCSLGGHWQGGMKARLVVR